MNRLLTILFLFFGLLCPSHADLIKQSSTYNRTVLLVSSTDYTTPVTGATLTITASKNGGTFASISPTVTELSNGRYSIALTTTHTNTLGALDLYITAPGAAATDTHDQVVAFDPSDATALGLSRIDAAISTRGTSNYAGGDTSGTTTLLTRISSTRAGNLDFLDAAVSGVPAAIGAQTYITIPGTGTTNGSPLALTKKQFDSLMASIMAGGNTPNTVPTASTPLTVTYYLVGLPKTSGNIVAVSTITLDSNKIQTGRNTPLIANPFPTIP